MGRRSKIITELPPGVRTDLEKRLSEGHFPSYKKLAEWLHEKGYVISQESIRRFDTDFQRSVEQIKLATKEAEAFVDAIPDDGSSLADVTIRLVQTKIYELLKVAEDGEMVELAAAAKAIATSARAGVEIRTERRRALKEAAAAADSVGKKHGLSSGCVAELRKAIEGVSA